MTFSISALFHGVHSTRLLRKKSNIRIFKSIWGNSRRTISNLLQGTFLFLWAICLLFPGNKIQAMSGTKPHGCHSKESVPLNPVEKYGQLSVEGRYLVGEYGDTVVLRGQSYGWSQWWPQYWNEDVVEWVTNDWKIDVIRGAVGAPAFVEYNDDPQIHYDLMHTVVEAAIENGIYVIIDWHAHEIYTEEAIEFFTEFAQTYTGYPNIIYEIFNEPTTQPWADVKAYSIAVIEAIREHDPHNIILIGTPHWCQDIHVAANDPIEGYDNLMYVLHFYADSHQQWLRNRLISVAEQGIPIFVSEMSGMGHTGSGPINYPQWQLWFNLMEELKISWVNYSLTDGAGQSCSVLLPGASETGGWTVDEHDLLDPGQLNESGIYIRNKLRRIHGVQIPVFSVPGIVRGVDYTDMSGIIVVGNDPESLYGGQGYGISAGNIANGDWLEYEVEVAEGQYTFHFNIASTSESSMELLLNNKPLASLDLPNTQGAFSIVSMEDEVVIPQGQHTLRILATQGSWQLHWWYGDDGTPVAATGIRVTPESMRLFNGQDFQLQAEVIPFNATIKEILWASDDPHIATVDQTGLVTAINPGSAYIYATTTDGGFTDSVSVLVLDAFLLPGVVQAEDYYDMHGIQTEPSSEGGINVGWIDPGDWMDYIVHPQKDTTYLISFRVASLNSGGRFQLQKDQEVLTEVEVPVTGGWQSWVTVDAFTHLTAGPQILRIHSLTSGWNIAWWQAAYAKPTGTDTAWPAEDNIAQWKVYPNPLSGQDLTIVAPRKINDPDNIRFQISNTKGIIVYSGKIQGRDTQVCSSVFKNPGVYFIRLQWNGHMIMKKILLP